MTCSFLTSQKKKKKSSTQSRGFLTHFLSLHHYSSFSCGPFSCGRPSPAPLWLAPCSLQTVFTPHSAFLSQGFPLSLAPTSVRTSFSSLSVPPFHDLHTYTFKSRFYKKNHAVFSLYVSASCLFTKQNDLSLNPFLWIHSSDLILVSALLCLQSYRFLNLV